MEFNSGVTNVIELDTLAKNRGALTREIDGLQAERQHRLARCRRARPIERLQQTGDPERINAIVAMTDGRENASRVSLQQLVDEVRAGNQKVPVVIFSVAYGNDADYEAAGDAWLDDSGGQVRAGTPETIRDLYKILSSYF